MTQEEIDNIKYPSLSDILYELQSKENDGRGISAIRGTCTSLDQGDIEGAKQGIRIDWDKIRNYPKIAHLLKNTLMKGEPYLSM